MAYTITEVEIDFHCEIACLNMSLAKHEKKTHSENNKIIK